MKNRVIILRLIGGLGNQLFQLQYAQNLQRQYGGELQIDDSFLAASSKSHETLAIAELIETLPIVRLSWFDLKIKRTMERLFYKLGVRAPNWLQPTYLFENAKTDVSQMPRIIVDGFWQNASNLNDKFVQGLRKGLQTHHFVNAKEHCVCVHIRRGDYLTNRHWFMKQQIVAPLEYYQEALAFFREQLATPKFEIYTDDEPWAVATLGQMADVVVIPSQTLKPFELLAKMATYQNYVIANSTLSWWAAVASWAENKQVVLPRIWGKASTSTQYQCVNWVAL